jgi:hypothetical protein
MLITTMKTQMIAIALVIAGLTGARADVNPSTQQLDGSWMTVGFPALGAPPSVLPAAGMETYFPGGSMLSSGSRTLFRSTGHGQWIRTGDRRFTATFVYFVFDPSGKFTETDRITENILLNEKGDEYTQTAVIQMYDADGNLTATRSITGTGKRMTIGDLSEQP